jgi:hypothetical protein
MSAKSMVTQLWAPLMIGAVSTAALGFAINFLTAGKPSWWWWLLLVIGILGTVVSGLWGHRLQSSSQQRLPETGAGVTQQDVGGTQQGASGRGVNATFNADRGSVAAWHIGKLRMGGSSDRKADRP